MKQYSMLGKYRNIHDIVDSVAGPKLWNSLTMTIKLADSLDTFKSRRNSHLFTFAVDSRC